MKRLWVSTVLCLAACGQGGSSDAGTDAIVDAAPTPDAVDGMAPQDVVAADSTSDVAGDAPADGGSDASVLPSRPAWPVVPNQGGTVIAHPEVIVVTYAGFAFAPDVEAYAGWLVGSNWITTVGADYGVGAGSVVGNVRLTTSAPATINESDLGGMLAGYIAAGTLPTPADGLSHAIYVVYFPSTTTVVQTGPGGGMQVSCTGFLGDHTEYDGPSGTTPQFSFVVIPDCPSPDVGLTELGGMLEATSHEVIETATDPFPSSHPTWAIPQSSGSEWLAAGGEVADLCVGGRTTESGHEAQRVWSNTAAASGGDPCLPHPASGVYYNDYTSPTGIQLVSPGDVVHLQVTGWSNSATGRWTSAAYSYGDFDSMPALSMSTFTNGTTGMVTLHVPTTASSGNVSVSSIYSYAGTFNGTYTFWPVILQVR